MDLVVVRDKRIFAYGWAFSSAAAVMELQLRATLTDGSFVFLPLTYGKERRDVADAFPDTVNALYSGWMAYAAWEGVDAHQLALVGRLADGSAFFELIGTPASPDDIRNARTWRGRVSAKCKALYDLIIGSNATDMIKPNPRRLFDSPRGNRAHDGFAAVNAALASVNQLRCALVIDHDMGGGANHFRNEWMADRRAARPVVLMLSFDIATLRYVLEINEAEGSRRFHFEDDSIIHILAKSGLVDAVFYNDAVSFPRPGDVPGWLLAFRRVPDATLTIAIHDYFAVCPSQFLLNDAGRFCGVPDVEECLRCLPRNDREFSSLFTARSIPEWRERWGAALEHADEIVCFSNSSVDLLTRAYPGLKRARVHVRPHKIAQFLRRPDVEFRAPLHIGVVGAIGMHKGAGVLQALAQEIARQSENIKITVIGSVDLPCNPEVLNSTGSFARDDLPQLIEQSGANVFLLPSICPETFSYVTQELMALGVPLLCFDFGAPAERVASYPLGSVVPLRDAPALLDALRQLHQSLPNAALRNPQ